MHVNKRIIWIVAVLAAFIAVVLLLFRKSCKNIRKDSIVSDSNNIDSRLNLNNAGFSKISSLPYISVTVAKNIIEYRDKFGPYSSMDDLLHVHGIGPKLLIKLKDYAVTE